jgi:hypothetical protein
MKALVKKAVIVLALLIVLVLAGIPCCKIHTERSLKAQHEIKELQEQHDTEKNNRSI